MPYKPPDYKYSCLRMICISLSSDIGGYAWDYNYFFDTNHTAYSQWRGWQWVRTQLLLALPHLIMDHRYGSQYDGPWSWVTLNGYNYISSTRR